MNCHEAMSLLPVYSDGELDPVQSAEVEKHVVGCVDCAARRGDLVGEVVANHSRATLGNRLTDVASSDQHTVKPWLSARLDYSPPVRDFSADGLPLVGGRLDYLDGRPVATLVYKYREHTIDVFMRPVDSGKPVSLPKSASLRGFNVAHGTAAGMECWAVSDVSMDVLASLVAHLTSSAG